MTNRLHRSRTNRVIGGVCGGLGEYFDVDPTFVRLLFVLLAFWHGLGLLAYIVLWIVTPERPRVEPPVPRERPGEPVAGPGGPGELLLPPVELAAPPAAERHPIDRHILAGALLVLLGLIILTENLHLIWWLSPGSLWPLILIALGAFLLYKR